MENQHKNHSYLPALHFDWLTPFYDFLISHVLREEKIKGALIDQGGIQPRFRILDIGCGTATLTLMIQKRYPLAEVVGIDPDQKILILARRKATRENLAIELTKGSAENLPYPPESFDRLFTSLMLHHLEGEQKKRAASEMFRVLKAGGEVHIADWGKPHTLLMHLAFFPVRLLDGFKLTQENFRGLLAHYFEEAGFECFERTAQFSTPLGTLALFRARKP